MADNDFDQTMKLSSADQTHPGGIPKADQTMKLPAADPDRTMKIAPPEPQPAAPADALPPAPPPPAAVVAKASRLKTLAIVVPVLTVLLAGLWYASPMILGGKADKLAQAGNHPEAAQMLEWALRLRPLKPAPLWTALGREDRLSRDYAGAEKALVQALKTDPALADAQRELAQTYFESNQKQKAFDAFRKYLQAAPSDWAALKTFAGLAAALKDYPSAADAYEKLAQAGAASAEDEVQLGTIYLEMNKLPESEKALLNALQKDGNAKGASLLLAKNYALQGRFPEAVGLYQAELAKAPGDAALIDEYAQTCLKGADAMLAQKKAPDALQLLQAGLSIGSSFSPALRYRLAAVLAQKHKTRDALANLQQALHADPALKPQALSDPAFASLRRLPQFRKITR